MESVQKERIKKLNENEDTKGQYVMYWMSRDVRVQDNWALLYAQGSLAFNSLSEIAKRKKVPIVVTFALANNFMNAGYRHFAFLLRGVREVESTLKEVFRSPLLSDSLEIQYPFCIAARRTSKDHFEIRERSKDF